MVLTVHFSTGFAYNRLPETAPVVDIAYLIKNHTNSGIVLIRKLIYSLNDFSQNRKVQLFRIPSVGRKAFSHSNVEDVSAKMIDAVE